jgi:hypothetical protein
MSALRSSQQFFAAALGKVTFTVRNNHVLRYFNSHAAATYMKTRNVDDTAKERKEY